MSEQPGNALRIITVGTTLEPLAQAISEADNRDTVVLCYGRSLHQDMAPLDVAAQLRAIARKKGLDVQSFELSNPEHLETTLQEMSDNLQSFLDRRWSAVCFNITGGTKVMSGALTHLAQQARAARAVTVEYTGGAHRDRTGRVAGEMVTTSVSLWRQHARLVLDLFKNSQYQTAFAWAETLPEEGSGGLAREGLLALAQWDRMEYGQARKRLSTLSGSLRHLQDDRLVGPLVPVLERIKNAAGRLVPALGKLDSEEKLRKIDTAKLIPPVLDGMALLAVDSLENARRRLEEQRFPDVALRSYRAVEVASQRALLKRAISPWASDPPLALERGLQALKESGMGADWPSIRRDVEKLQSCRNYSFLEHGYSSVNESAAMSSLKRAADIMVHLLEVDSEELLQMTQKVSLRFD